MKLKTATVRNFRSARDLSVQFDDLTRLIGPNGSGKSTALKALELFYAPGTPQLTQDDFFRRDDSQDIEIALTFTGFTDAEREVFGNKITDADEMTVTRVFVAGGGRASGKYYGVALRNPDFGGVRQIDGMRDKLNAYRELRERYPDLADDVRRGGDVEAALQAWEESHPGECVPSRDDGQFFGFQNVAQGKLQAATSLVFVPAVRDASQDVAEGRGTPITMLMDLVVRSAIEAKPELRQFREEMEQRYKELTDPANLAELGTLAQALTGTLQTFYPDSAVQLLWQDGGALEVPLPGAAIRLDDDGFDTPVDKTGHGLQRALIMTLLQHLAAATRQQPAQTPDTGQADARANAEDEMQPSLILAIEEPEVYQHPTKQRHIARVLEHLASGKLPGTATATQVVYCTHSPLFMSMDRFDEVRMVRRDRPEGSEQRECVLESTTLNQVAEVLEHAWQRPPGTFSGEGLKPKLHIMDSGIAEGFFASVAVVVEGVSDRAAILAAAALKDTDLEAREIAVVVATGKGNIDKPVAIFQGLGIPAYAIWDSDDRRNEPELNRVLQRLCGVADADIEDSCGRVETSYACFREDLETMVKAEIGEECYVRLLDALKEEYGVVSRGDAQKTPAIMTQLLKQAAEEGARSATLERIVDAIVVLAPVRAAPGQDEQQAGSAAVPHAVAAHGSSE